MNVTKGMLLRVKNQIRSKGIKMSNGDYVFSGKREDIVFDETRDMLRVVACDGSYPVVGKIMVLNILNGGNKKLVKKQVEDVLPLYEMVHLILKCNGENGFLSQRRDENLDKLNDYAAINSRDF